MERYELRKMGKAFDCICLKIVYLGEGFGAKPFPNSKLFQMAEFNGFRTYEVREKVPRIRGVCAAHPPYSRVFLIQLRSSQDHYEG